MLSIIIPISDESTNLYFLKTIKLINSLHKCELIIIGKELPPISSKYPSNLIFLKSDANSRGERLRIGFKNAKYNRILLHHPRSLLEKKAIIFLLSAQKIPNWGGFTHQFGELEHASAGWMFKFTSWYSNFVRADLKSIFYLDHCIFFNKSVFKDSSIIPIDPIFEDTILSQSLLKHSKGIRLPYLSKTSPVRFETNGFFKQVLLNQYLKICFNFGLSTSQLNKVYEKGLELNSNYFNTK